MAHTTLFNSLLSAFRISAFLNQNKNISIDEFIEKEKNAPQRELWKKEHSRRTFLKAAAFTAGGLLLPANAVLAKNKLAPRVVVVGAGISGLNAAYKLRKAGIYAKVFEASKRPGGRILTIKNMIFDGSTTEFGAEFIDTGHHEMHGLIKEFNLETIDVLKPGERDLKEVYYFNGMHYTYKDLIKAAIPYIDRFNKDFSFYRQDNLEMIKKFDDLSIAEYLNQVGVSGWFYDLLDAAYATDFGADIEQQSAVNFIDFASVDMKSKEFALYGESDERYKIKGGNQRIPDELFNRVKEQVRFEHVLEAISPAGSGYRLTFQKQNGAVMEVNADYVILAIPISILKEITFKVELPPLKKKAIKEIPMGQNTKFFIGLKSKPWRDQGYNGNFYTDQSCQSGWEHTRLQKGLEAGFTVFLAGSKSINAVKTPEQTNKYLADVNNIFPDSLSNGKRNYSNWRENPYIKGSYSVYLKGQTRALVPELRKPVGNIYFAGEQTSSENNGYMNGGAETGRLSAEAVIKKIKNYSYNK